jgi:hypothetical protein
VVSKIETSETIKVLVVQRFSFKKNLNGDKNGVNPARSTEPATLRGNLLYRGDEEAHRTASHRAYPRAHIAHGRMVAVQAPSSPPIGVGNSRGLKPLKMPEPSIMPARTSARYTPDSDSGSVNHQPR